MALNEANQEDDMKKWILPIAFVVMVIAAVVQSARAESRELVTSWYCKTWEAHNAHFSAAAHGDWRTQLQAIRYMQRMGQCVYDRNKKATLMHVIGEISYKQPDDVESNRTWWQALMARHENGKVIYFVRERRTKEGWQ